MTLSPRTLVGLSVALTLAVCTLAISLALSAPVTGLSFRATDNGALRLATDERRIVQMIAAGDAVAVDASLAMEEPDMLATYAEYNAFMATQDKLANALVEGRLEMQFDTGERVGLVAAQRHLPDLPLMFWLQLLFGVGGMLTGALVLAGRPEERAAQLYALTGLGYLIFAPAAAVYSTRELLLDGEVFRLLSVANHFGALLFTGSLTALLWSYPLQLARIPVVALVYVATAAAWIADTLQSTPELAQYHLSVLVIFALSFLFAFMQWWKTRHAPAERAALRWFLLSIYLATGLFAGVIIVPAALGVAPPASQGVMFGAFLLMYWGLALGIIRYRLFALEQWWRAIWWWFLGGVTVIAIDIALVSMLALPDALALSVAVALVGWLYFPLRQWLWTRIGKQRERTLAEWLPDVLPLLIETRPGGSSEAEIRERWPNLLSAVFRPLRTEPMHGALPAVEIREHGLALAVPDVRDPSRYLVLHHPDEGERLFTRNDVRTLAALRELFELALDRLRARDSGARLERERIRRDIHDDLGARLLTLLHTTPEDNRPVVREALDDLRLLVRALESDSTPLRDAVDGWQAEARKRAEAAGATLQWRSEALPEDAQLNARQQANLTRIMREAVSNALRHASPASIAVDLRMRGNMLVIEVRNDGTVMPLAQWRGGRGRQIMQGRAIELGGTLGWQVEGGQCLMNAQIPLA